MFENFIHELCFYIISTPSPPPSNSSCVPRLSYMCVLLNPFSVTHMQTHAHMFRTGHLELDNLAAVSSSTED